MWARIILPNSLLIAAFRNPQYINIYVLNMLLWIGSSENHKKDKNQSYYLVVYHAI